MILERKKNSIRNIFFGFINKISAILFPFLIRTLLIYTLGEEYLGLNSLFASILQMLNLAELGFSSAIVFAMYKPVAENDNSTICALLALYKKVYRVIGIIILGVGIVLLPFLKYLIKDGYPSDINLYVVFVIYLCNTVISYEFFAYKNALLEAYQRNDIESKITFCVNVIMYICQIVILIGIKNYYCYVIMFPLFTIIINLVRAYVVNKMYPKYKAFGKVDQQYQKDIFSKVKALFIYKIGNIVSNAVDNVVISAFLGLYLLAVYNNYYYIISALFGFLMIYYNAIKSGIGNSIVLDTVEKNYTDFSAFLFAQGWIVGWSSICLICLFQNFMIIWMGKERLLSFEMVIMFAVYFYVWKIHDVVHTYKDALGMWEQDKFRPLVSSIVNLGGNLILVQYFGLYGIVLSTIISEFFVTMFWAPPILYKNYFKKNTVEYYKKIGFYTVWTIIVGVITYFATSILPDKNMWTLLIKVCICILVPNFLYYCIYRKMKEFRYIVRILRRE